MITIMFSAPVSGPITQRFGENPASYIKFGLAGHSGIDYGVPIGTQVAAAAPGKVEKAENDPTGFGNYIKIDHGNGIKTIYGHLSHWGVMVGQQVMEGQVIGQSGNTGNSTGPHLHFEVRDETHPTPGYPRGSVDPLPLIKASFTPPVQATISNDPKYKTLEIMNARNRPDTGSTVLRYTGAAEVLTFKEIWGKNDKDEWVAIYHDGRDYCKKV